MARSHRGIVIDGRKEHGCPYRAIARANQHPACRRVRALWAATRSGSLSHRDRRNDFRPNVFHRLSQMARAACHQNRQEEIRSWKMSGKLPSILAISVLAATSLPAQLRAEEAVPNLSGTYRCEADPSPCTNSGQTFTVTQTGAKFEAKNDKDAVGAGTVTSKISVSLGPPWNTPGIILPDNKTIEWSAGTKWLKQ
jgi:hypothetical protein